MYTTKKSLLEAIQNGDNVAWEEFYKTYRPLIFLRGKDLHLSAAELETLCQDVMVYFFKRGKRFHYDRSRGRFRDYLRIAISHIAYDIIRKRRDKESSYAVLPEEMDFSLEEHWENEWRSHIFQQALISLKARLELVTYQAFELYAIQKKSPEEVAEFLNMSVNSVYVAKSRAMTKLKEIIRELQEKEE